MTLIIIANVITAFLFPLIIPITYHLLADVNIKAQTEEKNGRKVIKENINVFQKELPTAFLANVLWGITLNANYISNEWIQIWMIFYTIMTIALFFLIMYVKGNPKKKTYKRLLMIAAIFTVLPSAIRIFMIYNITIASS